MVFQPQPLFEDAIKTGILSALDETVTLLLSNSSGAIVNISGTWVGTIVFEGTNDDFVTVQNASIFTPPSGVITSGITANGYYRFVAVSGFTKIRARMSSYTSGSATVILSASIGAGLAPTVSVNYDSMLVKSKIVGSDGSTVADVELIAGKKKLLTDATVTVEEVFGQDPFPDSYFKITQAGSIGDTVRLQVAATTADPSAPDSDITAVDLTYTLVSADAGDEFTLRDNIVVYLNAQSSFINAFLKAQKVKDIPIVHITSTKRSMSGEFYERPNGGDFNVTTTGVTTVSLGFNDFKARGKSTSLARDPDSPHRLGILGISGSVLVTPGSIENLYIENAKSSGSADMRVGGSLGTPVVFTIPLNATKSVFIQEVRFYGGGNSVKFEQFLSKSGSGGLSNGIKVEIKSNNFVTTLPIIKTTEDFKNKFSFGGGGPGATFRIDIQAGADQVAAAFIPEVPFVLKKVGTFPTDDYIKVFVQDDLSSGLSELEMIVRGFLREE